MFQIVNDFQNNDQWFAEWKEIFSWDPSKKPTEGDILKIRNEESISGWTASNSLKRIKLDETGQGQLRIMYLTLLEDDIQKNDTIRWRIVHTLGAFPSHDNIDLLIKALEHDPYKWTQFGAARSLMEIAAKTDNPELRKKILEYFETHYEQMDVPVREEMGKTSMYFNADGNWESEVRPLLKKIDDNIAEGLIKDEWKKIMDRFDQGLWKNR